MEVTLYTTHCPKCKVIETKLKQKEIPYETVDDVHKVTEKGAACGITSAPILVVDNQAFDFLTANRWIANN